MKTIVFILIGCVIVGSTGCGKKSVMRKYYILEPPLEQASDSDPGKPLSNQLCEVLVPEVTPVFATTQIAIRQKSHEIAYFFYHRWAVPPQDAIANFIELELQRALLFKNPGANLWKLTPAYQIGSEIEFLEFIEVEEQGAARLRMTLFWIATADNQILIQHHFDRTELLATKNLNDFARKISQTLHQELNEFLNQIRQYLQQNQHSVHENF